MRIFFLLGIKSFDQPKTQNHRSFLKEVSTLETHVAEAGSIRGLQVDQKYQVTIDNIKDNNLILQFFHGRSEILVITLSSFDFEPGAF